MHMMFAVKNGEYVQFAVVLIGRAVDNINRFLRKQVALADARLSYRWLMGIDQGRCGLSCEFICEHIGKDYQVMVERLSREWRKHSQFWQIVKAAEREVA